MRTDLYAQVTDKIIAELETGAAPWVKNWNGQADAMTPANASTGRPYRGINVLVLWAHAQAHGYASPRYVTFKQALAAGAPVRKGEHGTQIYFFKPVVAKADNANGDDEARTFPVLRAFTVFNIEQLTHIPAEWVPAAARPLPELHSEFDRVAKATGADIRHGGDRAFFSPSTDFVQMPHPADFVDVANYRSTLAHELTHWTGHKSRLDRQFGKRFGDQAYAAEELVAELGAAFQCARFGIAGELRHAGYIENWLKLLKSDKRAIFTAAAAAQRAVDMITGEKPVEATTPAEDTTAIAMAA